MEYAEKGELFHYIISKGHLNEYEANKFFHQLIDSVDYIHQIGICHRDLKPENLLLDNNQDLKLIDFGLSNLYLKNELIKTPCGSPGYASPEMLRGEDYNGLLSDIWSCGVILYVMLFGYLPFDDESEEALYKKIIIGKFNIPNSISDIAKNLIEKILVTDPNQRYNIELIRKDPWYNLFDFDQVKGLFISCQEIPIDFHIVDLMKNYGYKVEKIISNIKENRHNNITTLYYLLVKKNYEKKKNSISDLISNLFKKYVSKNNKQPKSLKLMKLKSKLIFENKQSTQMQTPKEEKKIKELSIDYLKTIETSCKTDRTSSRENGNKIYLDNIDEKNEYTSRNKKIDFQKLLQKMPNKNKQIKKEANFLKTHLKSQIDNINKKTIPFRRKNINPILFIQTNCDNFSTSNNKTNYTISNNKNERNYFTIRKRKCISLEKNNNLSNSNQISKNRAKTSSYEKRNDSSIKKNNYKKFYKNNIKGKRKNLLGIKKIDLYSLKEKKYQTINGSNQKVKDQNINLSRNNKQNSKEKTVNLFLKVKPLNLNIKNLKGINIKMNSNRNENKIPFQKIILSYSKKKKEYRSISEPKISEKIKIQIKPKNKKNISVEKKLNYYEKKFMNLTKKNNSINIYSKNNSYDKKNDYNISKGNINKNGNCYNLKLVKNSINIPFFNGDIDKGIIINKPISNIKEKLISILRKNKIDYLNNGIHSIICNKGKYKFKIDFYKIKNKCGIFINMNPIKIDDNKEFLTIQNLLFSNINNIQN